MSKEHDQYEPDLEGLAEIVGDLWFYATPTTSGGHIGSRRSSGVFQPVGDPATERYRVQLRRITREVDRLIAKSRRVIAGGDVDRQPRCAPCRRFAPLGSAYCPRCGAALSEPTHRPAQVAG